VRGLRDPDSIY